MLARRPLAPRPGAARGWRCSALTARTSGACRAIPRSAASARAISSAKWTRLAGSWPALPTVPRSIGGCSTPAKAAPCAARGSRRTAASSRPRCLNWSKHGVEIIPFAVDRLIEAGRCDRRRGRAGARITGRAVVLATGTFLGATLYRGRERWQGGRVDARAATALGRPARRARSRHGTLKTGTPPRLDGRTIDWAKCAPQPSDRASGRSRSNRSPSRCRNWPARLPAPTSDPRRDPRRARSVAAFLGGDRGAGAALLPVDRG